MRTNRVGWWLGVLVLEALLPDTFEVLAVGALTFAMLSFTLRDVNRQSP